jgi:hypothetical protein
VVNECRRFIEENDIKRMDKRFPNYLQDTDLELVREVDKFLVAMEQYHRIFAQLRFDILTQYG